jgi:hypothetical protein
MSVEALKKKASVVVFVALCAIALWIRWIAFRAMGIGVGIGEQVDGRELLELRSLASRISVEADAGALVALVVAGFLLFGHLRRDQFGPGSVWGFRAGLAACFAIVVLSLLIS